MNADDIVEALCASMINLTDGCYDRMYHKKPSKIESDPSKINKIDNLDNLKQG